MSAMKDSVERKTGPEFSNTEWINCKDKILLLISIESAGALIIIILKKKN